MKVRLLHPEHDVDLQHRLPWWIETLVEEDLELGRLFDAMAAGDGFLRETAQRVFSLGVTDPDVITYRQQVLADCIANRAAVQQLYDIAVELDVVGLRRKVFVGGLTSRNPEAILRRSVRILGLFSKSLRQLRGVADEYSGQFRSAGLRQLSAMFTDVLSDEYLDAIEEYYSELQMPRGLLLSARLGLGNRGERHLLHQTPRRGWWGRLTGSAEGSRGFTIDANDLDGEQALSNLAGYAVNDIANTVTQSVEHFQEFFGRLRTELGFYLGCANLRDELAKHRVVTCFPVPRPADTPQFDCRDLRDVGLCLAVDKKVTGNDIDANGKASIIITGANEGGKSTFLRSVGAAMMMMQAGMFVTAAAFEANVREGVFTHFPREEDATLVRGKLGEELARMSAIVDHMGPRSLLLCNESFASTNEVEGSQIGRGVLRALVDSGVRVFFVTHLYDLARSLYVRQDPAYLFLRAERRPDGVRTFRLIPGRPEPTSHGEDSFRRIFGIGADSDCEPVVSG